MSLVLLLGDDDEEDAASAVIEGVADDADVAGLWTLLLSSESSVDVALLAVGKLMSGAVSTCLDGEPPMVVGTFYCSAPIILQEQHMQRRRL